MNITSTCRRTAAGLLLALACAAPAHAADSDYTQAVGADSPYGHWRLDESFWDAPTDPDGNDSFVATDSSGNGHQLSYRASQAWTFGQAGAIAGSSNTAVRLAGQTNMTLDNWAGINGGMRDLAVEMWVRFDAGSEAFNELFGLGDEEAYAGFGVLGNRLWVNMYECPVADPDGSCYDEVMPVADPEVEFISGPVTDEAWHHIALERDTLAGEVTLYLDGAVAHQWPLDTRIAGYGKDHATRQLTFLGGGSLGYAADELALYQQPLGATRVSAHYQAALVG